MLLSVAHSRYGLWPATKSQRQWSGASAGKCVWLVTTRLEQPNPCRSATLMLVSES